MKRTLSLPNSDRLAFLAATVALEAPKRQGRVFSAYIPWHIIHEIRKELNVSGWPWKEAHAKCAQLKREAKHKAAIQRGYI